MTKHFVFTFALLVAFNYHRVTSCVDQLLPGGARSYGYSIKNGPNTWASTFDFCNGSSQSPVALTSSCEQVTLVSPKFEGHFDYREGGFTLYNTGHTVEVHYSGDAPVLDRGPLIRGNYILEQVHFHWGLEDEGSEHQCEGIFYGMEAHMVHYKREYGSVANASDFFDGLSVVALMFEVSEHNSGLDVILENLSSVTEAESISAPIPGDAMTWLEQHLAVPGDYFTYHGSLTTPPCTEDVMWIVLKTPATISRQQIAMFRTMQGHNGEILENRRDLQPINDRHVLCSS